MKGPLQKHIKQVGVHKVHDMELHFRQITPENTKHLCLLEYHTYHIPRENVNSTFANLD